MAQGVWDVGMNMWDSLKLLASYIPFSKTHDNSANQLIVTKHAGAVNVGLER